MGKSHQLNIGRTDHGPWSLYCFIMFLACCCFLSGYRWALPTCFHSRSFLLHSINDQASWVRPKPAWKWHEIRENREISWAIVMSIVDPSCGCRWFLLNGLNLASCLGTELGRRGNEGWPLAPVIHVGLEFAAIAKRLPFLRGKACVVGSTRQLWWVRDFNTVPWFMEQQEEQLQAEMKSDAPFCDRLFQQAPAACW